jgi:pimeloyl-ACP methyl ester carboxylesterase
VTRALSRSALLASLLLVGAASCGDAPQSSAPEMIATDPARSIEFESHGSVVKGRLYRPAGSGAQPTVVFLQGMPGSTQDPGLAHAIQRAGWTVITFRYRGSWGSAGTYRLANGAQDLQALLTQLAQPGKAGDWGVDASRIALVGHSYGGYVAAQVAAETPALLGAALLAPWDISFDQRTWATLPPERRNVLAMETFIGVDGRLAGATAATLTDEVMRDGADFDLTALAPRLAPLPLLIVTVTHDDDDDKALGLLPALAKLQAPHLATQVVDTDHNFDGHERALEDTVVRWLATLPGAPH